MDTAVRTSHHHTFGTMVAILLVAIGFSSFGQSARTGLWFDSARHSTGAKSLAIIRTGLQTAGVPPHEKAHLFLLGGSVSTQLKEYDTAQLFLTQATTAFQALNDSLGVADSWYRLGVSQAAATQLKDAVSSQQRALEWYTKIRNTRGTIQCLLALGDYSMMAKKSSVAREFYRKALDRSTQNHDLEGVGRANRQLAALYNAQKDYRNASLSLQAMHDAFDSLKLIQQQRVIDSLEERHGRALEQKDRDLVAAEAKHTQVRTDRLLRLIERDDIQLTFYSVAAALIFLVISLTLFVFYFQRRTALATRELETERLRNAKAQEDFQLITQEVNGLLTQNLNDLAFAAGEIEHALHVDLVDKSREIRQLGEWMTRSMSDVVWLLDPNNRMVDVFIAFLRERTQAYFQKTGINYMIVAPDRLPNAELTALERLVLFQVTFEILSECVTKGKATGITLTIGVERHQLVFRIKDNHTNVTDDQLNRRVGMVAPYREKMDHINATIGAVREQGAAVVIYRKELS